jgi:hypothetical protein
MQHGKSSRQAFIIDFGEKRLRYLTEGKTIRILLRHHLCGC